MGEKVIVNIKTFLDGHRTPDRVLPSMREPARRTMLVGLDVPRGAGLWSAGASAAVDALRRTADVVCHNLLYDPASRPQES
jgi:hypothetical protein